MNRISLPIIDKDRVFSNMRSSRKITSYYPDGKMYFQHRTASCYVTPYSAQRKLHETILKEILFWEISKPMPMRSVKITYLINVISLLTTQFLEHGKASISYLWNMCETFQASTALQFHLISRRRLSRESSS